MNNRSEYFASCVTYPLTYVLKNCGLSEENKDKFLLVNKGILTTCIAFLEMLEDDNDYEHAKKLEKTLTLALVSLRIYLRTEHSISFDAVDALYEKALTELEKIKTEMIEGKT
jgi:hypothetical protein